MNRLASDRASQLLDHFPAARIMVIGDLMLDVYLRGAASRISPEAPVPVVRVEAEWTALGGAANVAGNLAKLGAEPVLAGVIGEDAAADTLLGVVRTVGLRTEGIVAVPRRLTTVKTRVLVGHQQVARYDREVDDVPENDVVERLCAAIDRLADGAHAMVLEDYDKGVLVPPVIDAALDAARRRGIPVVVDPKARNFFDYRGATVFKPNRSELAAALRAPVLAEDGAWLDRTRRHLECENLLVTLGADGMALMTESGEHLRVPAVARSVYDVSGAGDTVTAVLAATLAAGGSVEEAAILATHAAGIEVGKPGVATVSAEEILDSVRRFETRVTA